MNTGFSNLEFLKKNVLAGTLQTSKQFDVMLETIGLGAARAIENYCNRKFCYTVGLQEVFGADRCQFLLSCFPVIGPITAVEFKLDEPTGWVAQDQTAAGNQLVIRSLDEKSGIINFPDNADCGPWYSQMRFTYTGGYFWEQVESGAPNYPTAIPAGATPLPADLLLAWLTQVRKDWEAIDKVGDKILDVGSNTRQPSEALAGLDLVPRVKGMLQQYVRYQLT